MPRIRIPGVYVEEVSFRPRTIADPARSLTGFVGPAKRGPLHAISPVLASYEEFARIYGGVEERMGRAAAGPNLLAWAVKVFFAEGGRHLHVVRVAATSGGREERLARAKALAALADVAEVVAAPGAAERDPALHALVLAEARRSGGECFFLLDPPRGATESALRTHVASVRASSAALYAPWVAVNDAAAEPGTILLPPSGFLAGIYARVEEERGLAKAPANVALRTATSFEGTLSPAEQETLNPTGVNALRVLPRLGPAVWGARTTSDDPEWRYVPVRRLYLRMARTLRRGLAWVAMEPVGPVLWAHVRQVVENYLDGHWRAGALQGTKREQAFFVRCDPTTMTAADVAAGRVIVLAGLAFVKPAEFTLLRVEVAALPGAGG